MLLAHLRQDGYEGDIIADTNVHVFGTISGRMIGDANLEDLIIASRKCKIPTATATMILTLERPSGSCGPVLDFGLDVQHGDVLDVDAFALLATAIFAVDKIGIETDSAHRARLFSHFISLSSFFFCFP